MAGTAEQKAYAAGLIDGEGCISIDTRYNKKYSTYQHTARVQVHMTDDMPLNFLSSIWGGSITKRNRTSSVQNHWRDSYDWVVSASSARAFLLDILPYLLNKKEQARLALQIQPVKYGGLTDDEQYRRVNIKRQLSEMKRSTAWQPQ